MFLRLQDSQPGENVHTVPTVLLTNTTWWPCAARLALAFTRVGCEVAGLFPASGHPLSTTSAVHKRFKYSALRPVESLNAAIEATNPQLIIPCDDRAVEHLHELHARAGGAGAKGLEIRSRIEQSIGPPTSYSIVSGRYQLLEIAREEGLRVPDTGEISSVQDLRSWTRHHAFPWVLKADRSWGGHGVRIVNSSQQAEEAFAEMARPLDAIRAIKRMVVNRDPFWLRTWREGSTPSIIAQSHVSGPPANCAVACWDGEVVAGIAVEVVVAQGATGSATIARVVEGAEMVNAARRIAGRLGLSGLFGLDFVIEEGSGSPILIEMNPRCTPLCHLQMGSGHDMVEALRSRLSSSPFPSSPRVTQNDLIAYFPQAWHWDQTSEYFTTSYHDIPSEEPALVQELLRTPWPDRSLLARLSNRMRGMTFADRRSKGGTFGVAGAVHSYPKKSGGS